MRPARPLLAAAAALTAAALAGCVPASAGTPAPTATRTEAAVPAPVVEATVSDGATIEHDSTVQVTVSGGRLESVSLSSEGATVPVAAAAGTTWSAPELKPLTTYALAAAAVAPDGQRTSLERTFTTGAPARELTTDVTPWGDQVVGIGHPVTVRLNHAVAGEAERAAVQDALVVTADKSIGPASWSWISDTELQYRPKEFWPPYTHVTIDVNLAGVQAGDDLWGTKNRQVKFSTGRSQIITVDAMTHSAEVVRDGEVVRTMGVSLGKPGKSTTTRSGVKVVMSRHETYRMRSDTLQNHSGTDYDVTVPYAVRLTWSGEFLHGAPWNGRIGSANTSNGCYNLRVDDAKWVYDHVVVGDPVITTGTDRPMEEGNGLGGAWDVSWERWTARSAG